jgi:hypothetical protein
MANIPIGPHALNMHLQSIKYACEVMGDYERVVTLVDALLAREFDDAIWKPAIIEDIRHALEMIVLFAYTHCKEDVMHYIAIIRKSIDQVFISHLLVAKRLQDNIDMGMLDGMPELVRQKVFNEVMANL